MSEKKKVTILSAKDLDISYYVGSGAGGQNKQKNATGVQMVHKESGAIGRCSETRSQVQNKKKAFQNLCKHPKMKFWLSKKVFEIQNKKTMEEVVEEQMHPDNLIVEMKDEHGNWVPYKEPEKQEQ